MIYNKYLMEKDNNNLQALVKKNQVIFQINIILGKIKKKKKKKEEEEDEWEELEDDD